MKIIRTLIVLLSMTILAQAQDQVTSFGIAFKPIFPSKYFRTGPKNYSDNGIDFNLLQKSGISMGAVVRRGIGKKLAFEGGMMYTKRNYEFSLRDTSFTGGSAVKIIGYEIPLSILVMQQLGQQVFMSTGLGTSIDLFPSDVAMNNANDKYYLFYAARKNFVTFAVTASMGVEYRTKKSGILYFGANYHRSFAPIFNTLHEYYPTRDYDRLPKATGRSELSSDYFTFDIRYYFHEDKFKREKTQSYKKKSVQK